MRTPSQPSFLPALAATIFSRRLNRSFRGYCVSTASTTVSLALAAPYTAAIGESTIDLITAGTVHPFFLARLLNPLYYRLLLDRRLGLNLLRMVHAGQSARWFRPVRIGERLDCALAISGFEDTPAGETLVLEGTVSSNRDIVATVTSSFLVRNPVSKKPPTRRLTGSSPSFIVTVPTSPDQARQYARASGDINPIHTNAVAAFMAGLDGPVMHGLCTMAMAASALTRLRRCGDYRKLVSMSVRFRRPLRPGSSIVILGQGAPAESAVSFEAVDPQGRLIMSHGLIEFGEVPNEQSTK